MNRLFTLLLFTTTYLLSFAQPNVEWSNTYGGSFGDIPRSVFAIPSGGYMIAGLSMSDDDDISNNNGKGDGWLFRIDDSGNLLWEMSYGAEFQDEFKKIIPANDGGFIVAGYRSSATIVNNTENISHDFWVIKIDEDGNLLWEQIFGGERSESIVDMIATEDGYLLLGNSDSPDFVSAGYRGQFDPVLLKINNNGQELWSRRWGGAQNDFATGLHLLNNGRIVVSGYADSKYNDHHGATDGWLTYLNPQGLLIWSKFFGGSLTDQLTSVTGGPANQIYAAGYSYSEDQDLENNTGLKDAWLIRVNTSGDLIWSKNFGGNGHDAFNKIIAKDNSIFAVGYNWSLENTSLPTMGLKDFWLSNIDINGNLNWESTYGGNRSEEIFSFDFSTDNGLLLAGSTQTKFNGMVENNNGLEDIFLVRLEGTGPTQLVVSLGSDQTICSGASINLTPSIPNCSSCTITWEDGSNSNNRNVSPTTTTTYSIIITDEDGITANDDITIFVSEVPVLDIELVGGNLCPGDFYNLNTNTQNCSGCSYSWNDGNTEANRTLIVIDDIAFSLTITNQDGCSTNQSIEVPVQEAINFTGTTSPISCQGANDGQITIDNNSGNTINFAWDHGAVGANLDNLSPGSYTVTAGAIGFCAEVATYVISEPDALILNTNSTTVSCFNQNNGSISTSIGGGMPPYDFEWSNGAVSASQNNLSAGTYSVTITDSNGCSISDAIEITQPDAIQISSSLTSISCNGASDGSITITPFGGAGDYTFDWANGNTTNQLTNLSAGSYLVAVIDGDGCSTTASFLVEEPLALDFNINAIPPTTDDNGSILAVPFGGTPPYQLLWNTGSTSFQIINLTNGLYTVTVTDQKGCTGEESILFEVTNNDDLARINDFTIFPNPNNGDFQVSIELENTTDFSLTLVNTLGQTISTERFRTDQLNKHFDFSTLASGVYYLLYTDQKGVEVKPVVIE